MELHKEISFHKLNNVDKNLLYECNERSVENQNNRILTFNQIMGMCLGFLHYTCAGILSGFASVIVTQLKDSQELMISKSDAVWIASIVIIPTAPASLFCGFLLTKFSKKTLLIVITLVESISWLIMYQSTSVAWILTGRALSGIASTMGSPIVPPYLGEILHPSLRGLGLSLVFLGMAVGVLIIHTLGAFFTWRICSLMIAVILMVYFVIILYVKETYVWYLNNDNVEMAKKSFYWYRRYNEDARVEIYKLVQRQREDKLNDYSTKDMIRIWFSKLLLMPLLITGVGMVTMHLSGNKTIMFYSISIVSNVIPSLDQYLSTIIVDAFRIVITLAACFLINRYPIRTLFITSGIGSALSHFSFAAFHYYAQSETIAEESSKILSILALLALLSYIMFSSIGLAPLAWVIAGEIFPMIVKGIGSGLCCFIYFSTFFVVIKISPELFDAVGISGGFLFFGVCTLIGTIIMYFILPETRHKTLKEIEDLFR